MSSSKAIHVYVLSVCTLALIAFLTHDWPFFFSLSTSTLLGFAVLTAMGLLSEASALSYTVGKSAGSSSITFIPALACVLLFGPAATVLFLVITGSVGEFLVRQKPPIKATFNVAQWTISASVAGLVFTRLGGVALSPARLSGSVADFEPQFGPFIAFGVALIGVNHVLVSGAIAVSQDIPFGRVWALMVGRSGTNVLYDLLVSPIAIVVAFLYFELGITGLVIILLPLFFIRFAYLTNSRLQEANEDLLSALVKAIETRDPYTSGHSLRVSALAKRIAKAIGASGREIEAIGKAALLHDIGKIDVVYSEILSKSGSLSHRERRVIESHVIKGEELLKSLSSFKADVTGAVRHHHERVDGKGYPDGLEGDAIPLGARVIKVCDAIDAMLSNRPYRRALPLEEVEDQLRTYAGSQFDAEIVNAVLDNDLLRDFWDEVAPANRRGDQAPSRKDLRISVV